MFNNEVRFGSRNLSDGTEGSTSIETATRAMKRYLLIMIYSMSGHCVLNTLQCFYFVEKEINWFSVKIIRFLQIVL